MNISGPHSASCEFSETYDDCSYIELINDSMIEYEKLEALDTIRRDAKKTCYKGPFRILLKYLSVHRLFTFTNTPIFWCSICLYVFVRLLKAQNLAPSSSEGIYFSTPMSTLGTFMSFAVTFFTSNCYQRFVAIYTNAMSAQGRVFDIALVSKSTLPIEEQWRIWRYMNVAHTLAYVGLSDFYTKSNLFDPLVSKYKLLTHDEYERIISIGIESGGSAYREVLTWVTESLYRLNKKGVLCIDDLQTLISLVRAFRGSCGSLYDYVDQPIPMVYIVQSSVAYTFLLLYSYYCALSLSQLSGNTNVTIAENIFGALAVIIVNFFVCGMLGVGRELHYPFDNSVDDFTVLHFIKIGIFGSSRILRARPFGLKEASMHTETGLSTERDSTLYGDLLPAFKSSDPSSYVDHAYDSALTGNTTGEN